MYTFGFFGIINNYNILFVRSSGLLILASNSPRRKEILEKMQYKFICAPVEVNESFDNTVDCSKVAEMLALRKAKAGLSEHPNDTIIGSDTVVVIDNQILLKPKDTDDAYNMLSKLSGRTHQVYTGVAICNSEKSISFTDCASVTFDTISDTEIFDYISTLEPMDKAGAYAVQGIGCKFIKEIKGDYYTVMGLPSNKVYRALEGMDIL